MELRYALNVLEESSHLGLDSDDLKFPEEIWSNLQRAIEAAEKAKAAFSKV
jgi:hypothetical protein